MKRALASRALVFKTYQSEEMYQLIRDMQKGTIPHIERSNATSPVIEDMIHMIRKKEQQGIDIELESDTEWEHAYEVYGTAAFNELGYARQYSPDKIMSRTKARDTGLFLMSSGIPTSLFGLGGMPPVTGWSDVLVTAAIAHSDCYISHNSIYAGGIEHQLKLFEKAKQKIETFDLPDDMYKLALAHIGISGVKSQKSERHHQIYKSWWIW
jgi:hypothetical protein